MADVASQEGGHATAGAALCLDLTREAGGLKASLYPVEEGARTLRGYERYPVDWGELEARCASLAAGLNLLASQRGEQRQGLAALERVGGALFDALLSPRLKEALIAAPSAPLLLSIDDGLVHIPWELLFDGENFLCLRHATGRVVRTEQAVPPHPHRDLSHPLGALLLADPQGNLVSAYTEGRMLRDTLAAHPDEIEVALKTSAITVRQVCDRLREADLVHFAGHATYRQESPGDSGWMLKDGTLSPREIRALAGGARLLPSLIFSNACQSGQTSAWRAGDHFQEDIFGLANAFLLAGVRHYVGTFFDIPDEASVTLATAFYDRLLAGEPVGEALRAARQSCVDLYGRHHPIWASYMLYGDPAFRYRPASPDRRVAESGPSVTTRATDSEAAADPVATRSAIAATPGDLGPGVSVPNRFLVLAFTAALGVLFLVVGVQRGILPFHRLETALPSGPHAGPMVQALSPAVAEARDRLVGEGIDRERSGDLDGAAAAYRQGLDANPGDPYLQAFVERLDRRIAAAAQGDQQRHIDDLITRISDWKRGQPADAEPAADTWTSRPLTLAFLGFTETGESRERVGTAEYLALLIQDQFSRAPRVDVVERELLDALLRELNLSTTELIDRTASLPIGRLLAARVLAAGRLFYLPEGLRVMVRLFDAETGLLLAVKSRDVGPRDDPRAAVAGLVDELHETLLGHYPLRARLQELTPEGPVIDAGYRAGVRTGQRFATVVAELDASRVVLDTAHPHVVREVREGESVLDVGDANLPLVVGERLQAMEEASP